MTERKALALAARCKAVKCCPLGAAMPGRPSFPIVSCGECDALGIDRDALQFVSQFWDVYSDPHAALEVCEQIGLLQAVERGLEVREKRAKEGKA